jgi:ligand-binding sensor domain-containing protein
MEVCMRISPVSLFSLILVAMSFLASCNVPQRPAGKVGVLSCASGGAVSALPSGGADVAGWKIYTTLNSALPGNNVRSLLIDSSGRCGWIGTSDGLAKFDGARWDVFTSKNSALPDDQIRSIATDGTGNTWIGTGAQRPGGAAGLGYIKMVTTGGLVRIENDKWTVQNPTNSGLPGLIVFAIAVAKDNKVWIGTDDGLAVFDGKGIKPLRLLDLLSDDDRTRVSRLLPISDPANPIQHPHINSIAIEDDGVWLGTTAQGLGYLKNGKLTLLDPTNSGLPDPFVESLTIDDKGNKWVGTIAGLSKYDGRQWVTYDTKNSRLPDNEVTCILVDPQRIPWIGTRNGLAEIAKGGEWKVFNKSNSALPGNWVYSIATDATGNLWIGTDGGLTIIQAGSKN